VLCVDDAGCRAVLPGITRPVITYGKHGSQYNPTYSYESNTNERGNGFGLRVYKENQLLGDVFLSVPGEHNKSNALAAMIVALELNAKFADVAKAISHFKGVDRRFQMIGEHDGTLVVDDYAHHPTEVVAVLQAARQFIAERQENGTPLYKRVVAVFQPHQPGRLRDFWDDFIRAFSLADMALITDVYVARGAEIEGINSERFVQCIDHPDVHYIQGPAGTLAERIVDRINPGDLVITIGAGDITKVAPNLVSLLKLKQDRPGGRSK
ncbi:MAG TPA: cyanophycin synthetase, partial [Chroococcales cyanobacterium]